MILTLCTLLTGVISTSVIATEEVNVYSYRQPFLIEPMFEAFTEQTGIQVNVKFAKKGLAEKMLQEGEYSPADVVLATDISRLIELVSKQIVQPVHSDIITTNIPAQFRDSHHQWFALTLRTRNVYSSRDRVGKLGEGFHYKHLATPRFKGKVCTRSGKHPYNISLIASMIAHKGEKATKAWLKGVKSNLARKPQGNDRAQVKAIKEGLCDVSLGNSYYLGKMVNDDKQKAWADAVHINFPNQRTTGTHVNVSGMAMAKHAPNRENAQKLMEFLTEDTAQQMYAEVNYEYPVKTDVKRSELVESWGEFTADDIRLEEIAKHHSTAVRLVDEVRFDL
ncbi:Fe(3+) ABC transporter substrate-binding protein [Vibrio quintilis]|nr:Fe(3+) ABC transporter substrate-binding protein [Vibrio quintilis]